MSVLDKFFKSKPWRVVWQMFSYLFIKVGLALLAWGPADLLGFLAHPVRAALVVLSLFMAVFYGWLVLREPTRPDQEHQPDLEHWHYSVAEMIFLLAAYGDRRGVLAWEENLPLRWLGLGIYLLGLLYIAWCNLAWVNHLRREPGSAVEAPVLLFEGPFRWTRYPILLGLFFYSFGFALAFRSWVGLVLLFPLVWVVLRRVRENEILNAQRFKKNWALHCRVTKKLIPFVY